MLNPFEGKIKREIMIEIGQIAGDEPGDNDIIFNIALDLNGKQAWQLVDKILLDFKHKITPKYLKLYTKQLRVILANLYRVNDIEKNLYVFYSRARSYYKKSKRYNS